MRTRVLLVLLVAMMLATMATVGPATAKPKPLKGQTPCLVGIWDGSAEVPSDRWVSISTGWIASTKAQVEQWLGVSNVSIALDGEPLALENEFGKTWVEDYIDYEPPHPEINIPPLVVESGKYPSVYQVATLEPLAPGSYTVTAQSVLSADTFDGVYQMLEGDSWFTEIELVVTPAELFPVGGYDQTCAA